MPAWNPCRFFKTLLYFGALPGLDGIGWVQTGMQTVTGASAPTPMTRPSSSAAAPPVSMDAIALIADDRAPLGSALASALRDRGWSVRPVRPPVSRDAIGGTAAIICLDDPSEDGCHAERAIDAANQGGDRHGLTIFDFRQDDADPAGIWGAVDDVVMGGVSDSRLQLADGTAIFTGTVSVANNGGFASVRTRNFDRPLDLTGYDGIELRVRGDGQRYKFIARSQAQWDGTGYSRSFDTVFNTWTTVRIPFDHFIPVFRARTVPDGPPLAIDALRSFQIMLSKFEYDGGLNPTFQPGTFSLEIESIRAYGGPPNRPLFILASDRAEAAEYLRSSGLPHAIVTPPAADHADAIATTIRHCLDAIDGHRNAPMLQPR